MILPVHLDVALWRYLVFPCVAAVCAWAVFRRASAGGPHGDLPNRRWVAVCWTTLLGCAMWLTVRRTLTYHYGFFDLGVYANKSWLLGSLPWADRWANVFGSGHTQPLMLVYGALYRVWSQPVFLQVLQVLCLGWAGWWVYRLAVDRLGDRGWAAWVTLGLWCIPAFQFGMVGTFRPDHLVVPLGGWALWSAHRRRWGSMVVALGLMGCVKEPYWLTVSAFGGMLWMTGLSKRWGWGVGLGGAAVFLAVWWLWPPHMSVFEADQLVQGPLVPQFSAPWHPKKLLWGWMLILPLAGVPLLAWRWLIPAAPTVGISLISANLLHVSTDSHYALAAIPFLMAAFIEALRGWREIVGEARMGVRLKALLVFGGLASVASSPLPYGLPFWHPRALGGMWTHPQYAHTTHEDRLREVVAAHAPKDVDAVVVTHNGLVDARLVNRRACYPFSGPWRSADLLILDDRRGPGVEDGFDEPAYREKIQQMERSGLFERVVSEDGIHVWRKR